MSTLYKIWKRIQGRIKHWGPHTKVKRGPFSLLSGCN